jgi:hypothetical protein
MFHLMSSGLLLIGALNRYKISIVIKFPFASNILTVVVLLLSVISRVVLLILFEFFDCSLIELAVHKLILVLVVFQASNVRVSTLDLLLVRFTLDVIMLLKCL